MPLMSHLGSWSFVDSIAVAAYYAHNPNAPHQIEIDRRGPIKTWEADRLLFAKKNPEMIPQLIPYPEQYEASN